MTWVKWYLLIGFLIGRVLLYRSRDKTLPGDGLIQFYWNLAWPFYFFLLLTEWGFKKPYIREALRFLDYIYGWPWMDKKGKPRCVG